MLSHASPFFLCLWLVSKVLCLHFSIFSPSFQWCVSVTSLLVPCSLEEGTQYVQTQKRTARFVQLSLAVCFYSWSLTLTQTGTSKTTVWRTGPVNGPHEDQYLREGDNILLDIRKGKSHTSNRHTHMCTNTHPQKVQTETDLHTGSSHILWEVNNTSRLCLWSQ